MNLSSTAFENLGLLPTRYTCDGDTVSPPLFISDVPAQARSLVLIMDDPDVPQQVRADGMWNHWIIFNISPDTAHIPENTEPIGVHGAGTSGTLNYDGPCPPDGEHRYFFKLYALDTLLDLPEGSTKAQVEEAMRGHSMAETELVGRYTRH